MRAQLFCCAVLLAQLLSAQERFGIAHSNYGGTDVAFLNPARTAGQWPYADIRFAGVDLFAWNSLVAWSDRAHPLVGELRSGLAGTTDGELVMRSSRSVGTHRAIVHANVLGPGVSLALGRGTIGAGVRSRIHVSASGIPGTMGNFMYEGFSFSPQHGIRFQDSGVRLLGAAWTEFGLNYAHILSATGYNMLSAGAGVRYNLGHAAGGFQMSGLDYTVIDTAQLVVHEATARYGFAMPAMNAGSGWGADLGMSYERTMDEVDGYRPHQGSGGCTPMRYRYRIGVSLIDLGGIRYRQAEAGTISAGSFALTDYTAVPVQDADDLDSLLATSTQWTRSQGFAVGLPTAISVQYDQRVTDNTYVAFAAVQQLSGRNSMRLRRSNALAITPRFEMRYFEAALPIVLNEYDLARPAIGVMLRFNGLVIGTDRIMPFLGRGDVHAVDFYVRLRWMIFRSPICKGKRSPKMAQYQPGSKGMIPCATPND